MLDSTRSVAVEYGHTHTLPEAKPTMHEHAHPAHNSSLPSPAEVEALDSRRQWGLNLLVIAGQFATFAALLLLWSGQDVTYSPGGIHPVAFYNILCAVVSAVLAGWGLYLRRGYRGL